MMPRCAGAKYPNTTHKPKCPLMYFSQRVLLFGSTDGNGEIVFPQQGLMMPDGLFSRPVPALKADHYRALCSFSAKAVAQKMSCHQREEKGMQHAGHYSDPVQSGCHTALGSWAGLWRGGKTQGFKDLVNDDLKVPYGCKPQVSFLLISLT